MMRVLIDAGSHNGKSVKRLMRRYGPFDRIFCFEPNLEIYNNSLKLLSDYRIQTFQKAVWIKDETIPLYIGMTRTSLGSSVLREKRTGKLDLAHPEMVEAIDFAAWLKKNIHVEDRVFLKLDIEGAEYRVIPHLLDEKCESLIDVLLCEWHGVRKKGKRPQVLGYEEQHEVLLERLAKTSIELQVWN